MKTVKLASALVLLSLQCVSALANTYIYKDSNGHAVYSDRIPVGVVYSVKVHPKPVDTPPVERRVVTPVTLPFAFPSAGIDPGAREMLTADASSAIKERDRTKSRECLAIQQNISRLSSSRNRSIDPDTGGSLEETRVREAQQLYDSICR